MTRLDRDPLLRAIYDATQAVEACGASEALTAAVMAVTAIYQHADRVLDERDEAIRRAETEARCAARYRWIATHIGSARFTFRKDVQTLQSMTITCGFDVVSAKDAAIDSVIDEVIAED